MNIAGEIERLEELRRTGVLSDEEFQQAKEKALSGDADFVTETDSDKSYQVCGVQEQTWCMLMHLSQLLVYAGGFGLAVPIIMWVVSKDESDLARRHGARMMNWIISSFIYAIVAGLLCFVLVGIPLIIVLIILSVAFPIMGAMKANDGILWSYPMTICFIEED